jgi:hypothetical protein
MEMIRAEEQTLALAVIPPPRASNREISALETAAQGLALDAKHPVALEIARTSLGRLFILRATSHVALLHVADQIQARYPQAEILPLSQDPLTLASDETVSAVELTPGAPSYLPLRTWGERELQNEGADPILGLLAALSHMPKHMRAVAQLSLLPISPVWSQPHRRMSVEHPLEPERQRQHQIEVHAQFHGPSTSSLILMGVVVAVLLLWMRFKSLVPAWIIHAGTLLIRGKDPHLTSWQVALVTGFVGICLILLVLLKLFLMQRGTSIYDMRAVAEKTGKSAYRARLRLFVIESHRWLEDTGPVVYSAHPTWFFFKLSLRYVRQARPDRAVTRWRANRARLVQEARARWDVLDHLTAAYRQYHTAAGGYFVPKRLSTKKAVRLLRRGEGVLGRRLTGWEHDIARSRHILSVADIGMLFHLPQSIDLPDLPFVERGRARTFLVPAVLTTGNGWKIGISTHAGHTVPVFLPLTELRRNFLSIASTGKGKSTLFQHLAAGLLQGLAPNTEWSPSVGYATTDGLFVLEPHQDLIEAILGLTPASLRESVTLVDLANREYPPGINPIDATLGRDRDKAVDNLLVIFEKIWENSWGPRTENVMEFALKTLAEANYTVVAEEPQSGPDKQYTLLDVVPLLRNPSFRHKVIAQARDQVLKNWWRQYYEPMDPRFQMEVTSSVLNKMSKFSSSRVTRRILGQPRSTINLTRIIHSGGILLVSTAAGVVGSDISTLIGSFLLGLFHVTLGEQAELSREKRRRYLTLIDEFQVYQGVDWNVMLAELRYVGGSFGLATQSLAYLDRIDRTLRATVMANIDHLFAFAMAAEDARLLKELEGIEVEDITNLDNYMCYARLSLGIKRLPVFSLHLDPPRPVNVGGANQIRERSQVRDARPVEEVDEMILSMTSRAALTAPERAGFGNNTSDDLVNVPDDNRADAQKSGRKRHKPKEKNAALDPPIGNSVPHAYEGVGTSNWGEEVQERDN